jgi:hypothetical protein
MTMNFPLITDPFFYLIAVPAVLLLGVSKSGFGAGFGAGLTGFTGALGLSEDGGVEVSTGGRFGVTGFGVTEVEVSAVGKVDGVLGAGAEPLGAGAATTNKICSGMIGALIWEGADIPAEVTVAIVNV